MRRPPLACLLAFTFAAGVEAAAAGSAAEAPPAVAQLLEAQGALEAGLWAADMLRPEGRDRVLSRHQQTRHYPGRIYAACRRLQTTTPAGRVQAALCDVFRPDLAEQIAGSEEPDAPDLTPRFPEELAPVFGPDYSSAALIVPAPQHWVQPAAWGGPPVPPDFAGWQISTSRVDLTPRCGTLVRADITVDDAELRGEVRADTPAPVFLILRSDIVLKFHAGSDDGPGALAVKFGYDNLSASTETATAPALQPETWVAFRVSIRGRTLSVSLDGSNVLQTVVARDPRLAGSRLSQSGRFGFGSLRGSGGFRNVVIRALTPMGRRSMPHPPPPLAFVADGAPVRMLAGPESEFLALTHNRTVAYKPERHPVAGEVLTLEGAPYVQFTRQGVNADHFVARGRLRFLEPGDLWLRVNSALLLGLYAGDADVPFAVKHTTRYLNTVDAEFQGEALLPNRWYQWELEYHHPAALLRLDAKTAIMATTPDADPATGTRTNQLGFSTYNTKAEIADVAIQKLRPGTDRVVVDEALAERLLAAGSAGVDAALAQLAKAGRLVTAAILEGDAAPAAASPEEVAQVAERLCEQGDWQTGLAMLEAYAEPLTEGSDWRRETDDALKRLRAEYEAKLKAAEVGTVAVDGVLRAGDREPFIFTIHGSDAVGISLPAGQRLLVCAPDGRDVLSNAAIDFTAHQVVARAAYALCVAGTPGSTNVVKVDLLTGERLATSGPLPGRPLNLVAHPLRPVSYLSVDSNTDSGVVDLEAYHVLLVDELSLSITNTGAVGMMLALDPLRRYLFAAVHLAWRPGLQLEPGALRVLPVRGYVDQLLRYQITDNGLAFDAQRPVPGIAGRALAMHPSGRYVSYVAKWGRLDAEALEYRAGEIGTYRCTRPTVLAGAFQTPGRPQRIAFNSDGSRAYVVVGGQLREFDGNGFGLLDVTELPDTVQADQVRQLHVTSSDARLLVAFAGEEPGVYFHRLRPRQAPDALAREGDELQHTVRRYAFTPAGEAAAAELLRRAGSRFDSPGAAPPFEPAPLADAAEPLATNAVWPPALGDAPLAGAGTPSSEATELREQLETLRSLEPLASEYPRSWLWRCHQVDDRTPGDQPELWLAGARTLLAAGAPEPALALAGQVVESVGGTGVLALAAHELQADVYELRSDTGRAVAALGLALERRPRDPFLQRRLGRLLAAAGCPNRARLHRLLSWRLYPSQLDLEEALRAAGRLPPRTLAPLDAAALFWQCAPAVAMVSHKHGSGTGFLVSRHGLLLTNQHVIEGAEQLTVTFMTGAEGDEEREVPARLIAADLAADVALLGVGVGDANIEPLVLADSAKVRIGDRVVAIGNPGLGRRILTHTATEGIVSGKDRKAGGRGLLQISAAVNPGNSGGPLLDRYGQVIGMVTTKAELENVGFAVPSKRLLQVIDRFCGHGSGNGQRHTSGRLCHASDEAREGRLLVCVKGRIHLQVTGT